MVAIKYLNFVLGLAAVASAYTPKKCNNSGDYCLRALRATQIRGRCAEATKVCRSILTPTHTFTKYKTLTKTITTETAYVTQTKDATITKTETEAETTTTDLTLAVTATSTVDEPLIERRANPTPQIPKWASACGGVARFTSACSCVGIKTGTPRKTTVTVTTTKTVKTARTIYKTETNTLTATNTKTIVETETKTTGETVATETIKTFRLKATYSDGGDDFLGVQNDYVHVVDIAQAKSFYIKEGFLFVESGKVVCNPDIWTYVQVWTGEGLPAAQIQVSCSIDASYKLSCTCGTADKYAIYDDSLTLYPISSEGTVISNGGSLVSELQAVGFT